ncbi:LEAF RUST 10 DISEASE-RESISTANCE LOCUS RECEPTOR-LIKE PROTEIN KINASE-like 1.1 isoform X3 [Vigna angularis]|uniref:LEAF RUST 10 DISEASE-RESISTANCE LOCUS RECEPTOR-LIKE PROTEIN KINASE-like 1.1 isoform X3 n=1 Tax=Phaseolus angularis TaxID=3914 RepID=UPI0022B5CC03|nr:LEAF RUST 10 DISEASE-RESISTANCE LOCUS RECEPTOR-LIKE PROTEIN KINASE-like 1.1 isoform X3 [Vigna angularis]
MSPVHGFVLLLLFSKFMPLLLAAGDHGRCSFPCGYLGNLTFPFTITGRPDCGFLSIRNCSDDPHTPKYIQLQPNGGWVQNRSCEVFTNSYTLPLKSHFAAFRLLYNTSLFLCNKTLNATNKNMSKYNACLGYDIYYNHFNKTDEDASQSSLKACKKVLLPIKDVPDANDPFTFVTGDVTVVVTLTDQCSDCHYRKRGQCQLDSREQFCCANAPEKSSRWKVKLALGLGIGVPCMMLIGLLFFLLLRKRKHATSGGQLKSRDSYSDSSSISLRANSAEYFGVPLFSYAQLKEVTNNFDHAQELGDGGFGTVYYGKLPDGREVAVKRLYEHNWRRVEQFMNEVKILTRLRHKNLVSLYGCTSRHSRELLLVYEYISNGTVACHLHGGLTKPGFLPWPTRMKIAIETASALAYLHASDIIHRDVKTNNILLDNNFCVKVADFGLSRDFPNDVTHVSTAPQGSPGYLDPEYYSCYQLTIKSDVYSFGVVLIELLSSKPAVDMNRSRDEINLSNLAVRKIQESAIGELVDPCLGFDSDSRVKGMIVSVAGLALQCLQREKELRPSMDEVLHELQRIESGKDEIDVDNGGVAESRAHSPPPASPEWDEAVLLKNTNPTSPDTVTDKWESKCTTPNISG